MARWTPLLVVCLLFLTACDEDTAGPGSEPAITGNVTDAAGDPVDGATVVMLFGLDGFDLPGWPAVPARRARTEIRFSLAEDAVVRLEIVDYVRRPVVALIAGEPRSAGQHAVVWDSLDGDGDPVPPGVYYAVLEWSTAGDPSAGTEEMEFFYYDPDRRSLVDRPHAVTDAQGRFRIDLDIVPVGEEITVFTDGGREQVFPISHTVRFLALVAEDSLLRSGQREVTVVDRDTPLRVDLQLD